MSRITGPIPERIRRMMPAADRQACAAPTVAETAAKQAPRLERDIQKQLVSFLRVNDVMVNVSRTDRRKTDVVGWPDLTFAWHGIPCAVEVKLPGEKPTAEQERVMAAMANNGWRVAVVRSLAELVEFLKGTNQ